MVHKLYHPLMTCSKTVVTGRICCSTKAEFPPYLVGRYGSEHFFAPNGGYCLYGARKRRCVIAEKTERKEPRVFLVLVEVISEI